MKPPKEHIPSKWAVIPYYVIAALVFMLVSILLLFAASSFTGHFFQPRILAVTHLAVLGWATMIIFGASNQLAPVISEQRLYSDKLPLYIVTLLSVGTVLLVSSFWFFSFEWYTYLGGLMILSAIVFHAINIYKTVGKAANHIVNTLILSAHAWLLVTVLIGFMLLVHLRFPFLPEEHLKYLRVHAGIGMAGWFLQLVMGVSSKLVPMFLLSRREEHRWLNVTFYLINLALIVFLINGMLFHSNWVSTISILMILPGIFFYGRYINLCRKTAMRKQLDQGMKQTFIALILLSLPFILLICVEIAKGGMPVNLVTAYGFSFFGGFISTIILGQTFKTLPFIVWMHITRTDQLPELMPKDLFNESWVKGQMMLYLPGFLMFLAGILIKSVALLYAGAAITVVASGWYLVHVLFIVKRQKRK